MSDDPLLRFLRGGAPVPGIVFEIIEDVEEEDDEDTVTLRACTECGTMHMSDLEYPICDRCDFRANKADDEYKARKAGDY